MISSRLRQFRLAKGFTLDQLAADSKVSRGTINRIELQRVSPRMDTLVDLCGALGTSVGELFQPETTGREQAASQTIVNEPTGLRKGMQGWLEHAEALIRYSADSLSVLDRAGFVVYESDAALQFHAPAMAAHRNRPWWTSAHPDDQAELQACFETFIDGGAPSTMRQYRAAHRDGTWHWVRTTLSRQLEHPLIEGIIASTQDVTLLKQLEDGIRQNQKFESLAIALGGITHTFSNLIMGVQGNLELAQDKALQGLPVQRHLAAMESVIQKAATLLDKMRDFAGNPLLGVEPLQLNDLVRGLASTLLPLGPAPAELRLELDARLPVFEADRRLLERLVKELLGNAYDALGGQGGTLTLRTALGPVGSQEAEDGTWIETGLEGPEPCVLLEIRDTGCGIPPADRFKLFDPFFTTKFVGKGMGLPAVLGTVRAHRGALRVVSEPGKGSCFQIFLPLSEGAPAVPKRRVRSKTSPKAILLVEDDPLLLACTREMLLLLGDSKLFEAANGEEAMALYRSHAGEIGLVLMDIDMPRMDGIEAYQQLRALSPTLSIVFATGAWERNHGLVTQASDGITGILRKPFDLKQLSEILKTYL